MGTFSSNSFTYGTRLILPEGKLVYEYNPLYNYRLKEVEGKEDEYGLLTDLITTGEDQLNFDLNHPVDIQCQKSYDGSVNLILNDNTNQPRLINTRFTARENNTYERVDRLGNTDTNIYDESEFEIDTSLLKKYINIPKINFRGVFNGGSLPIGNYVFYFKLSDADGNETDIVGESGIVTVHMGALNAPTSIRGGELNENSGKLVLFILSNIDSGYDYVNVYYTRNTAVDNMKKTVTATQVLNRYRVKLNKCDIHISGTENVKTIPVSDLSNDFFLPSKAKTLAICLNMLFLGNVTKYTPSYSTLSLLSIGFVPYFNALTEKDAIGSLDENYSDNTGKMGYYNVKNIYNKVGYWNEEIYRFGIVYIMNNGSLSPVYNIRGINNVPNINSAYEYTNYANVEIDYDTLIIDEGSIENSAGVCRINHQLSENDNYFLIRNFVFVPQNGIIQKLKELGVKGYFFVRQKRIPTILAQAFVIGKDKFSGIPAWKIKDAVNDFEYWVTETFLNSKGEITHDYTERLVKLDTNKISKASVGICPEYDLNLAYYNNLFTGTNMKVKLQVKEMELGVSDNHIFCATATDYIPVTSTLVEPKIVSVPDSGLAQDGTEKFRAVAGSLENIKFEYLCDKKNLPVKKNFEKYKVKWQFARGRITIDVEKIDSKIKIARGLYGPFLGIYNNNSIFTNSLINIYIPGYDEVLMIEYFKIRINCEDPYFSISERKSIDDFDLENGESCYRGDCYICNYSHRLNRNFQDPDAPTNDTIVDMTTWTDNWNEDDKNESDVNRGDLNAVKIGTYVTFKCYSSYNLAMRDWDRSYPAEEALTGCKRSFYPLNCLRIDGHSKLAESSYYNQGFSVSTGEKLNFLLPAVPYIKNNFLTRIIYSDVAQTDAFKNGFRIFKGILFRDYSNLYGGIVKILEWKNNLCVIFEHAVALVAINAEKFIPTDDGTAILVGAQKVMSDTLTMLSQDFGSLWADSICCSARYIYGIDTVGKKIWRTDGSNFELISDFKVQKFLNDNITLEERELTPIIGVRNVKTHYNAYKQDIMFTYYDNTYGFEETVWNLCYNELQEAFITFYSWVPSSSANIDNIYFSYDRNSAKWITKLGMSEWNSTNSDGVCVENTLFRSSAYSSKLHLVNRPLPSTKDSCLGYTFTLHRDNFGNYKYFEIVDGYLKIKDGVFTDLMRHMLLNNDGTVKVPIIPVIQLNILCEVTVKDESGINQSGSKALWEAYSEYNYGYYLSLVFLTFYNIYNNDSSQNKTYTIDGIEVTLPTFETDFWKHGFAGLIDVQEKIKPCYWYHKQHPFEFEYVVGNDTAGYKRFDNLIISSNNVKPESIHYEVIGDSYDFSDLKPAIYFRQEATKALYQYNGADILYDHDVFDKVKGYIPEQITSSSYIEKVGNETLRDNSAVSNTYKDSLFLWTYTRDDTFNEIEDYYKKIVAGDRKDYTRVVGCEVYWDSQLNQFSLCNHVLLRDIKEVGRIRGNLQYVNDKMMIQITPVNIYNRNNTWLNIGTSNNPQMVPKLVLNNIPTEVYEYTQGSITDEDFPDELTSSSYKLKSTTGCSYNTTCLDATPFEDLATKRTEIKLMDKVMKTKIRYPGDLLVNVLAIVTQFNTTG